MPDDSRHEVNLLDFFAFLLRWRRFIFAAVLSISLCMILVVLILPPRFKSVAVVRAQESGGQGIGSLIASKLGALSGLANLAPGLSSSSSQEMFLSILKSRWLAESVIEHFDLRSVYKMKNARIEDLIKALASRTMFDKEELSSDIYIYVEDRDPVRARDMAQFYTDQLDLRNKNLRSLAASSERGFIQKRLDEERARLTTLEDSLYRFQLATGVFNIEEQVKATIQASAVVEAQRLAARSELEMSRLLLGLQNPETEFVQYKLASIDSSLRALMHSSDTSRTSFLLNMDRAPAEGKTYVRLYRDIEIQQMLVAYLLQQFEQAKISELRDTPTLVQIDLPAVATKPVWPRRGLMVVIAAFGAMVLATSIAFFFEMLSRAIDNPLDPQHKRIMNIRDSWTRGSRKKRIA